MKKRRVIGIIFLLFLILIIFGFITGIISIPSIKNIRNRWGSITDDTTEIISSITIENNNPFKITIPRVDVDYSLKMNNIEMAHGTIDKINLEKGDTTIEVTSYFNNSRIPEWWVSHLNNNEITIVKIEPIVVIDAEFAEPHIDAPSNTIPIETNLLGSINNLDVKKIEAGPINLSFTPISFNWGNVSNDETELLLVFNFYNPYPVSIPIPEINYKISMNEIKIGNGTIEDSIVLESYADTLISSATSIDNNMLDDWFVSHLQYNENSNLKITINSTIEYEGINFKIDDFLIYTHEFVTNILGTEINI